MNTNGPRVQLRVRPPHSHLVVPKMLLIVQTMSVSFYDFPRLSLRARKPGIASVCNRRQRVFRVATNLCMWRMRRDSIQGRRTNLRLHL